ncbi:AgrD family cyclic lactone autoinducer peptide [Paenibacillus xerothermodurans]|uniref:Cyclic lactone autoinducer peptide n=1 Tax=Paenibacillus xerothermodurans TaxID=1977292 RepID=A0A2W1P1M3_PAEXE|nr:cyclic lactone autoinducer peptide [Paenibacillus xerothermodurans]PZE21008.1 cyclic lactone autoinducer peptide [Paenibacillus xerothermodurans]
MKKKLAIMANSVLMGLAAAFVTTNSIVGHRPETPQELLKK